MLAAVATFVLALGTPALAQAAQQQPRRQQHSVNPS
jgi:hypothetical protein